MLIHRVIFAGMNEILAPIYYIFATDPTAYYRGTDGGTPSVERQYRSQSSLCVSRGDAANAEDDAFFCFTNVMVEIRDNFCKTLDHSDLGITATMRKCNMILKRIDPPLWEHLVRRLCAFCVARTYTHIHGLLTLFAAWCRSHKE